MPPKENRVHPAKFIGRTEVAHETFEVRFKLEQPLSYEAGQYAWLQLPNMKYPDVRGDRRAFSIINPPDASGEVHFLFRGNDSGFKKTARALEDGDEVFIVGPFGTSFCLPENPHIPLVLVAGGVGIAPFLCLVRYIRQKNLGHPVTVVYADNAQERMAYAQEIEAIAEKKPARTGKCITKKLAWKDFKDIPELSKSLVYVSGTQGFVDYVHTLLKKNGVFDHRFRFENFYPTPAEASFGEMFKTITAHENVGVSPKPGSQPDVLLAAVESSSHHIIITDSNGSIVFCNKAAQDVTGYTFAEMQGQTPRLWGGLMPHRFYADMWKTILEGRSFNEEIVNRKKDGTLYTVIAHIAPIQNKAGEVIGFIGTEEDVTHIRSAEQQAKQNEERFVQLTEKITEVYWIIELTPAEHIMYVSPAFEPLWGMSRGSLKKIRACGLP